MEGGNEPTPMVPAHLYTLLNTGRGMGNETCEVGDAFPPSVLWFGLDTT